MSAVKKVILMAITVVRIQNVLIQLVHIHANVCRAINDNHHLAVQKSMSVKRVNINVIKMLIVLIQKVHTIASVMISILAMVMIVNVRLFSNFQTFWFKTFFYFVAVCKTCLNGGQCLSPNVCGCRMGFFGEFCEHDIDECATGQHSCKSSAICINMPGW